MNCEWLNNLKVGDEVFISGSGTLLYSATVSRITKSQIFIKSKINFNPDYEAAFWKKDGYKVGRSDWSYERLIEPTEEIKKRVHINNLKARVNKMRDKLATPQDEETLVKLIEALKPFVKE